MKIPPWVYERIECITQIVVGNNQWAINRRAVLRRFLAHIWLHAESTDDDGLGWTICTERDIRHFYHGLLGDCRLTVEGQLKKANLKAVLPTLADIDYDKGKKSQDVGKRKPSRWRFSPKRPDTDIGKLRLVDVDTGAVMTLKQIIQSNGKAPSHEFGPIPVSQAGLKKQEKAWLKNVSSGRMHISFVRALKSRVPDPYYRAGIRSLNHLYNAKFEESYAVYDHCYRLTFGGRYYDQAFQNLPNELKAKFRAGLLNYDIQTCNLACLNLLFKRYNVNYQVSLSIYRKMMKKTGFTRKQCKSMVHTTTYRVGKVTIGVSDGLGAKVCEWSEGDNKQALKILRWWNNYVEPLREALETLVSQIQQQHQKSCRSHRNYHLYVNDIGLTLDLNDEKYQRKQSYAQNYARNKSLLAFMICGVEQAYIREVVRLNPGVVCMLDHDGLVAQQALKFPDWEGFKLEIKG